MASRQRRHWVRPLVSIAALLALTWPPTGPARAADLVSSILPTSRSVVVGQPATAFAAVMNVSGRTLANCRLSLGTQIPATFTYQTTNPATNAVTGSPNTPVTIPAGHLQTFVFGVTPQQTVDPVQLAILVTCDGAESPALQPNLNTLLFSSTAAPTADVIALVSTIGNTGIADIQGTGGLGAFAVAAANVGATRELRVLAESSGVSLPVNLQICQTAVSGACLAPPGPSVTVKVAANSTPSFAVFLAGQPGSDVGFDPALNRITVSFLEGDVARGAAGVAVRTVSGTAPAPPASEADRTGSVGSLVLTGGSTTTFNPLSTVVKVTLTGATLLSSVGDVLAFNNGTPVPSSKVSISGNQIHLTGVLQAGKNRIEITAADQHRFSAGAAFTLWAGGNQSVVTVRNSQGAAQAGMRLRHALSDDPTVFG